MQNVKPWQIVLFVAAIGAIAFGLYSTVFRTSLDLNDSVVMVDVETGELFSFSTAGRRGIGIPNYNPDSGELSLLPVVKNDDGAWVIAERALPILADLDVEPTAVVDRTTGEVRTVGRPKKSTPKIPSRG